LNSAAVAVILFVLLFLGLALLKVPVGCSLSLAGMIVLVIYDQPLSTVPAVSYQSMDSFPYLAIPLFIYSGDLMTQGGISQAIVGFAQAVLRKVKGSLGIITIVASMLFGTVTGSALATVAAIGSMMIPIMIKYGYKRNYATALVAASGFLGVLIPPSIPGIFFSMVSGISVPIVWASTIVPAFLFATGYIIINYVVMGNKELVEETSEKYWEAILKKGKTCLPAVFMPLLIFGCIYGGIATPTEAAALSVAYGLVVAIFVYKGIKLNELWGVTKESAISSAVVCVIMAFAAIAARMITFMNVAEELSALIVNYIKTPIAFLIAVNIMYIILGMLIDCNTAILITGPIMIPMAQMYGIDLVHFGGIVLVNLCIGFITPPFASCLFVGCRVGGVPMQAVIKPLLPFIGVGIVVLILTTYFPFITTFVPSLFY